MQRLLESFPAFLSYPELYKKIYYSNCEFHSNEKCYETFSILKLLSQIL